MMPITVTIARQLGCGGSEIGQRLATALGCRCLDREIVSEAAKALDVDEFHVASREERIPSFWERMLTGFVFGPPESGFVAGSQLPLSDEQIFNNESRVMQSIADHEDCVIVGRGGAFVLNKHPLMVNVFLHAPMDFRINYCLRTGRLQDPDEAREILEKSDEDRRKFFCDMANVDWSCGTNYHISLDTSTLPMEGICEVLLSYVRARAGH